MITANEIVLGVARALVDLDMRIYAEPPKKTTGKLSALITLKSMKETEQGPNCLKREAVVRIELSEGEPISAERFSQICAQIGANIRPTLNIADRRMTPVSVEYSRQSGIGRADISLEFYDDWQAQSGGEDAQAELMQILSIN